MGKPDGWRREPINERGTRRKALLYCDFFTITPSNNGVTLWLINGFYFAAGHSNAHVSREGYARVYRRFMYDKTLLADEQEAKNKRLGIWAYHQEGKR